MKVIHKYYITFREGKSFGKFAVVYAHNEDDAFKKASNEFGVTNVLNVYTEFNWSHKYTADLTFLKEINAEEYQTYLRSRHVRRGCW